MSRFEITAKARTDLRSIGRYSAKKWGPKKRNDYLRLLSSRFHWIADNPNLGTSRPDIDTDYFCFPEGEHLIFYILVQNIPVIVGIPHKRMDAVAHFQK